VTAVWRWAGWVEEVRRRGLWDEVSSSTLWGGEFAGMIEER
jgi:hypothetical protein